MTDKRLAIILCSYKRPEELYRQLACLFRQTYRRFKVFVTVKGVAQYVFETLYQGAFSDEIQAGLLEIRFDPNKNQLSNYLDAIRGVDPEAFDLFVKIDDDDFYSPGFLEYINERHRHRPVTDSSFLWGRATMVSGGYGLAWFDKFPGGSGCAVSPPVIRDLLRYEKVPVAERREWLAGNFPGVEFSRKNDQYGMCEDNLIRELAQSYGYFNRWSSLPRSGRKGMFIPRRFGNSVTRPSEHYVSSRFREHNSVVTVDPGRWEYAVCLRHEDDRYESAFVFGDRIDAADGSWSAGVLRFTYRDRLVMDGQDAREYVHEGCDVYAPIAQSQA